MMLCLIPACSVTTRLRGWCARAVMAALLLLAAAMPAWPHAALVSAEPADGAVVATAPARFALTFSEPVSPLVLALVRPDGARTELHDYTLRDQTLDIAAPTGLAAGSHVLAWRVISEDGHPVGGSVVFSVGAPSATAPKVAETVDWSVRAGLWAGKVLLYCGLFLGVGGVVASVWLRQSRARSLSQRIDAVCIAAGVCGAVLSVGFQGLDALGAPLGLLSDAAVWKAGFATTFGATVLIAAMAFLLALLCLILPRASARGLSVVAVLTAGASLALSGHASAAEPQWLTRPAVFVHAVTIALWTGALLPLAALLRQGGAEASVALRRFSRFIPVAIAALIVAGIVLALIQVETPEALLTTAYGRVFLVKLALLAGLFGLAAFNRWRLTLPALIGVPAARSRLVRSIAAETAVVLLIFAVAACWRFTPPPRALAIAAAAPANAHIHTLDGVAEVLIAPGHAGPVTAHITIMTGDFGPLDAKEVTLVVANKAAGIEPIKRAARKPGNGTWRVDDLVLPVPGIWQVRVDILVSDFKLVRLPAEVVIRP